MLYSSLLQSANVQYLIKMNTAKYILNIGLLVSGAVSAPAVEITLFATGVDPSDPATYYNNRQEYTPTCWAASGSNVIAHWQDHNAPKTDGAAISPWGVEAPQGEQVYWTYRSFYNTYQGGWATTLFRYWLGYHHAGGLRGYNPVMNSEGVYLLDTPIGNGGFYQSYYDSKEDVMAIAWKWSDTTDMTSDTRYTTDLSRAIYQALSAGNAVVLDIKGHLHAITLWGVTFDTDTNLITKAWVTDSSSSTFRRAGMNEVLVKENNGKLVMDGDYYYGITASDQWVNRITIDEAHFLGINSAETLSFIRSGIAIPEPAAFGLFAGLFALTSVSIRRRRN